MWTNGTGVRPTEGTTVAPVPTDVVNGTNTCCARYYHISPSDTCSSITIMMGISLRDFYFLNPEVNSTNCSNLLAGYLYCVRAVGDIRTYPGYGGGATTSRPACLSGGSIALSCLATTPVPTDTYWSFPAPWAPTTMMSNFSTPTSLPLAPGMSPNCCRYDRYSAPRSNRKPKFDLNSCNYIAWFSGITIDQLIQWNPSLSYNVSNPSTCTLQQGYRYCVRASKPNSSSRTPTSTSSTQTTPPPPPQTTTASPTTSASTGNNGISTPLPIQPNITSDCTTFYHVQPGDSRYDIAQNHSIPLDDFLPLESIRENRLFRSDTKLLRLRGSCRG